VLTVTSLAVVLVAAALPFTPVAARLGFVAPPPLFFVILPVMVLCYLVAVEFVKRLFYRKFQMHWALIGQPTSCILPGNCTSAGLPG
jgi:Mg2+-importing ATPase